ncbi:MAG TPA: response regulator [Burkholderiales bacterium]|nr:response regulator [Burkholderiales bacterium]
MRALVVDDDIVSRMALIDLLQRIGRFEIVECEDGAAAWDKLSGALPPAICCCDVNMPQLSGIELLRRARGDPRLAHMPFVLVSAAADRGTVEDAVHFGASGYILKPFEAQFAAPRLEVILRGSWREVAEDPLATLRRLGIRAERLVAYLAAFRKQLEHALQELPQHELSAGSADRLAGFHTACLTLGLRYAAGLVAGMQRDPPAPDLLRSLIEEIVGAVDHQCEAAAAIVSAEAALVRQR